MPDDLRIPSESATGVHPTTNESAHFLLGNPVRAKILAVLDAQPGLNKKQIARRLDLKVGDVEFHLHQLRRAGRLLLRRGRGHETLCFTPDNVHLWDQGTTRVFFGRGSSRPVADYLAHNAGASVPQVAEALDISVHSVRRHIRILEDCKLVQRTRTSLEFHYHPEPKLMACIEQLGDRWSPDGEG